MEDPPPIDGRCCDLVCMCTCRINPTSFGLPCGHSDPSSPVGAMKLVFREEAGKGFPHVVAISDKDAAKVRPRRGSIFKRGEKVNKEVKAATVKARRMSVDTR